MASTLCLTFLVLAFFVVGIHAQIIQQKTYIVQMSKADMPSRFLNHHLWYQSSVSSARSDVVQTNGAFGRSVQPNILHVYETVFQGFSVRLSRAEAIALQAQPGVLRMFPDGVKQLHTTHTPDFLGLSTQSGIWPLSRYGEDVIVGLLDTGVWPERRSFSDHRVGAIPAKWKGSCPDEPTFPSSLCNKKLIGAKYYSKGYEAQSGPINQTEEFKSPRDGEGHGTHTASTAAGRVVYNANSLGFASGTARGMAPKARIAIYKVCWATGCFDSDILAAFDAAVADGVDVISLSLGGDVIPYYADPIAIGSWAAMKKGILVSSSAGNVGNGPLTVSNVAPWMITVAASTLDRSFPANVKLANGEVFVGTSLYSGTGLGKGLYSVIYAANASLDAADTYSASLCMDGTLDPKKVAGKIVLCDRGNNARVAKGEVAKAAGASGMILANQAVDGEGLVADAHVLPAAAVGAKAGGAIKSYLLLTKSPEATLIFEGTTLDVKPAPVVASFSLRGPSPMTPQILKPDITAPGVNILAAWTDTLGPTGLPDDTRKVEFNIISGTSMSCPHISGIAAIVKGVNPSWSPAAVKSAMMTSAYVYDNTGSAITDEATGNATNPFAYGAGHVDPEKAANPGLIYDLGIMDYLYFLCALNYSKSEIRALDPTLPSCGKKVHSVYDLNYPSFSAVFDETTSSVLVTSFKRTVTNVGSASSTYKVSMSAPLGVKVTVKPTTLKFSSLHETQIYTVTVSAKPVNISPGTSASTFGHLIWSDGTFNVRSPIAVSWQKSYPSAI